MTAKTKAKGKAAKPEPPRACDLTSAQKHAIYLSVDCDRCLAAPGQECKTPSGLHVSQVHQARLTSASKAGKIRW